MGIAIGAGLANSGISTTTASTALCTITDKINARRRMLRSRWRCAGSPSTRHPCSDPNVPSQTLCGSRDITHLHTNLREPNLRIYGAGPVHFPLEPAPRSQGCEVARVLTALDTAARDKFPLAWRFSARFVSPETLTKPHRPRDSQLRVKRLPRCAGML